MTRIGTANAAITAITSCLGVLIRGSCSSCCASLMLNSQDGGTAHSDHLDAAGLNHEHRRQCVGPRRRAGRPCDAAALVRTDLSPHFLGKYRAIIAVMPGRLTRGSARSITRSTWIKLATPLRRHPDKMDGRRQTRYPMRLACRHVLCRLAPVAQWIEYCPPKAGVAGSIPAGRATSIRTDRLGGMSSADVLCRPCAWFRDQPLH